jgi:hypothetical protein
MVQDLIPNDRHHIKGLARCHRIYNDVAMNANEVLRVQDTIFILDRVSGIADMKGGVHTWPAVSTISVA